MTLTSSQVKQEDLDQLKLLYLKTKREVDRGLAEMRAIKKQIDLVEDLMIIETMKWRDSTLQKGVIHG